MSPKWCLGKYLPCLDHCPVVTTLSTESLQLQDQHWRAAGDAGPLDCFHPRLATLTQIWLICLRAVEEAT